MSGVASAGGRGQGERLGAGEWQAGLLVALVAGLAYANAIRNAFTLDDDTVIGRNEIVRHVSGLWRAFAHPYWPDYTAAGQYRPLAISSFTIDWIVSHGSPQWFHAMNLLWHMAACVLVWRLLRELVTPGGALAGAIYFALQPVHVEAVANTVGRCDVMATVFVLAALLAHRRASWAAVPFYAAALGSKENGIVLLGLAVANDVLVGSAAAAVRATGGPWWGAPRAWWQAIGARRRASYGGYLGVAVLYAVALAVIFRNRPLVDVAPAWFQVTIWNRWLTEARVALEYVRLMVVPLDLKIEYSPQSITIAHGMSGLVALGLAYVAVSTACFVVAWRRAPVVAFGLAWFVVAVAPVSNIFFASGVVLAERTLYLPSVGAAVIVGWVMERLGVVGRRSSAVGINGKHARWWVRPVSVATAVLMMGAYAVRTWTRTTVWHDDKRLVLTSLLNEPESYRTHLRAAVILVYRKDWAGAVHEYAVARTLFPGDPTVFEAAAMVADGLNQFGLADRLYDSASLVRPGLPEVYLKQARLRYRARNFRGAIRSARSAYLVARDSTEALDIITGSAQQISDFANAEWAFQRGLADHPRDARLHQQYSWMLAAKGDTAASRREAALAARYAAKQGGTLGTSEGRGTGYSDGMSR